MQGTGESAGNTVMTDQDTDLERILWDIEYRQSIKRQLNAAAASRCELTENARAAIATLRARHWPIERRRAA